MIHRSLFHKGLNTRQVDTKFLCSFFEMFKLSSPFRPLIAYFHSLTSKSDTKSKCEEHKPRRPSVFVDMDADGDSQKCAPSPQETLYQRDADVYYNPRLDPQNYLHGPLSWNPATRLRQMLARPGIVVRVI